MPVGMQREQFEQGIDVSSQVGRLHYAERPDHIEVLASREIRVKIGLFGHIAEALSVAGKILANIFAMKQNLAARGVEQSGEHFYRGALPGSVGAKAAQHLTGLETERDFLNGG